MLGGSHERTYPKSVPCSALLFQVGNDVIFKPSSGAVKQVVTLYPSTTSVASSPNPSTYGQPVMLTATVNSAAPGGATGKVTFKNGTTTLGIAMLSAGTASLTTTKLPVGTLSLTAGYGGDAQSAKSAGMTVQTVN
jgi:Big-like domain-containing protein